MNPDIKVRHAGNGDAADITRLVHKLAEYENMADQCTLTPDSLIKLMNEPNGLRAIVAESENGVCGMAVYSLYKLATFSGKRVLYIEDIFVDETMRGCGVGSMLFEMLSSTARELDCRKIEWKCLAWNSTAREFYEKRGGISDPEWLTYTMPL